MKNWYRIEFFTEEFLTCVPSAENDYCVFSCERQYTSINRGIGRRKPYGKCP